MDTPDFEEIDRTERELSAALGPLGFRPLGGTHVDRSGVEVSWVRWMALSSSDAYRRVDFTQVCDGVSVSTVWVGISFGDVALPFETMVFVDGDAAGLGEGTETYRYASEAQAVAGHDQVVAELRSQLASA